MLPPAHSMVPSALLASPPAQIPVSINMGVCGKPSEFVLNKVLVNVPSNHHSTLVSVQTMV